MQVRRKKMFGCKDCLPPHLIDSDWSGTDNASWLMRQKKKIQYWLAIGPRGNHWYCKTRALPKTLFVIHGGGPLRYEDSQGRMTSNKQKTGMYLSRIQCWCKWHFAIQWPLFFQASIYYSGKNVSAYPNYPGDELNIFKMISFQIGYKRDGDEIHWLTMFFGGRWE